LIETVESGDTGGLDLVVPAVSLGKPALRSATSQKTGCFEQRSYTDFWADGKGRGRIASCRAADLRSVIRSRPCVWRDV